MSNEQKPNQNHPMAKPAETPKLSIDAESLQKALSEALTKGISEGMAMAQMAASKNSAGSQPLHPKLAAQLRVSDPCPECRQEKKACKGKHAKLAVFPRDDRWGRYFQGVIINGVTYRSNNSADAITVPANAGIERIVMEWENNEIEVSTGRKRQHVSGDVRNPNRKVPYFR
jgi:hypothetical protein